MRRRSRAAGRLLSPLIAALSLVVLVTAIVALAKDTRTWLRFGSRRHAGLALAGAAVALLVSSPMAAALSNGIGESPNEAVPLAQSGSRSSESGRSARPTSPTPTPTPTPVITTADEVVTEAIAFERTTGEDPTLARGQTRVTAGVDGERARTYRVTYTDGVESARELVSEAVTVAPVAEATLVGTYVAPPPPPPAAAPAAPSGCDPNYADACVPVDSDVDCAGGSGDGPSYFGGVARVVGTDIYRLDHDKDGYACE